MTYEPELSPINPDANTFPKLIYIGWLHPDHSYNIGDVPKEFPVRLWEFCRYSSVVCRGFHRCEFCSPSDYVHIDMLKPHPEGPLKVERDGCTIRLGFGEIFVVGKNGLVYYAPNLIYHYVLEHQYLPPQEFIDAVLDGPLPTSNEYLTIASRQNWRFTDLYTAFKDEQTNF